MRTGRSRARRLRRRLGQYGGFIPAIVLFGVFFVVPLGLIVAYSFWKVVDYNVVHDWTLDNYRYFFSVGTYVRTLWATIWVSRRRDRAHDRDRVPVRLLARALRAAAAAAAAARPRHPAVLDELPAARLLVAQHPRRRGRDQPLPRSGSALTDHPLSFFLYDRPAVILVLVYLYFPFAALTLYASLERFDWDQFKAAMDLGATAADGDAQDHAAADQAGDHDGVIFVFIPILGEYLTPQLVGGAQGRDGREPDRRTSSRAPQYTRGAAAALLVAALIVALLVVFRRSLEVQGRLCPVSSRSSRRARDSCAPRSTAWAVLVYVFLFAPIVLLVAFSFNANQLRHVPVHRLDDALVQRRSSATTRSRTRSRRR